MSRRAYTTMVVVFALMLSAGWAFAGALPPGGTFTDDDGTTHEGSIEAIAAEGITKGCNPPTNDLYCPEGTVTRAQMAAFLARALGLIDNGDGDLFTDDDGSIFENDIDKLGTAGVTKGCNPPVNDRYCPDGKVTRGQMAAFLVRAFGYTDNGGGDLFVDDDGGVFEGDIDRLGTAGVTKGCNPPVNDRYCPDANVLRDQMASFLTRALELTPMVPPARSVGSRENPVPAGTPARIGDWEVTVLSATPDATDAVLAENQFNDPPDEGDQFFIVEVATTYRGEGSDVAFSLSFTSVGASSVAYTFEDSCGVIPDRLDAFTEVFTDGTLTGNLCWAVASSDVDSLVLIVDAFLSFDDERSFLELP